MSTHIDLPPKKNLQDILSSDNNFNEIILRLKNTFNPLKIFLFGSRVYGTDRADSDYDFAVVVAKTDKTRIENMRIAREILFDLNISVDVFVYDEDYFNDWKNELNSIPEVAFNLGLELPLG